MPRFGALLALALGVAAAASARAQAGEIYKCVDARGRPLYTSDKRDTAGKKCEVVSREVNVVPAQKPSAKSPAGFPKESAGDRAAAKSKQRETLERELSQEESMLAESKRKLAEQEAIRSGDEKNYARVLERLRPYKDAVEVHEKNVEALKRELNNLSR
jgi:septal ring factor EnvC (AmiA/AmiB activator)